MTVLLAIGALALWQILPGQDSQVEHNLAAPGLATPTTSAEYATTTLPHEAFTYRVGLLSGVTTDNFWAFYGGEASVWNAYVLGPTKPALYSLNATTGAVEGELASGLATPAQQGDAWSVLVSLNESLSWSDGVPITAYDVVYTFETVRAAGLGGSWSTSFPASVETIAVVSPFQILITFSEQPTLAVWPHGPGLAPIMPSHIWDPLTASASETDIYALSGHEDVGGGPLSLYEVSDTSITSVANPGYPYGTSPDQVIYTIFATEGEAVEALGAGTIDSILSPHGLTTDNSQIAATYPAVSVDLSPTNGVRYLGFNLTREPMSDRAFRQALALLLDREALAASIPDMGVPAYSFVGPANTTWYDVEAASAISTRYNGGLEHRLDAALELLADAGYTWSKTPSVGADGTVDVGRTLLIRGEAPAPLTILTPGDLYDPARPAYAAEVATVLNWLGFDVNPVVTDFDSVIDLAFSDNDGEAWQYDMYLHGWTLGSPALPSFYRPLFAADGELNNTGYDSQAFEDQLARYESAVSYEEALEALWEMESTLASDLPYILLYSTQISEAYRADRVAFGDSTSLGGLQGRLGGIADVTPVG